MTDFLAHPRAWPLSRLANLLLAGLLVPIAACGSDDKKRIGDVCGDDAAGCTSGFCYEGQCLDPASDNDGDSLSNGLEFERGSNPLARDSDADGVDDGDELDAQLANIDSDRDGKPDIIESATADADKDCMPDQYDPENAVANPGGCWEPTFVAPDEGGVVSQWEPIAIQVQVTDSKDATNDFTGFSATLMVDGAVPTGDGERPTVSVPASGLASFAASAPSGPHTLSVTVTDTHGMPRSIERAIIVNTSPAKPEIAVSPEHPGTTDDLTVNVTTPSTDTTFAPGAGGAVTYSYAWRRLPDGDVWPSQTLHADRTTRGDVFEVIVTPDDGFGPGEPGRAEVTIGNSQPSCDGILLVPSTTSTSQPIECRCAGWSDADDDTDQSTCAFVDTTSGQPIDTAGSCTLPASATERGMAIGCTLTPSDGELSGTPVASAPNQSVLILDSSPTTPTAGLTPDSGHAGMEFTCDVATAATDPDGDPITYTVAWQLGDATVSAAPTVQPASLGAHKGDALCCTVAASDGSATSPASAPACVTLVNAPPELGTVLVRVDGGSFPASRRDVLRCFPQDGADADGDALTATFVWYRGDQVIAGETGATMSAAAIPVGTVVSCSASVCDDDNACTALVPSKTAATIANALPTVSAVTIPDSDGTAQRDDVLTCAWSGWDDPDGDPETVTYAWLVTHSGGAPTVIVGATASTFTVDAGLAVGDTVSCRVTPMNGSDAGPAKDSANQIQILASVPVAPIVAVSAPSGAEGDATCSVTTAGKWIPSDATWTWYWSVNGQPEVVGAPTRAAATLAHCDLLRCRVAISGTGLELASNTASLQMPLGPDCEDGNVCTSAVCFQAGGCRTIPEDGGACDDGDPCTDQEQCSAGKCVGTVDTCVEERLSLGATAIGHPFLGAGPTGGYATTWLANGYTGDVVRATDADLSQVGEEQRVGPDSSNIGYSIASAPTIAPDGTVVTLRNGPMLNNPYFMTKMGFTIYLSRWSPEIKLRDEVAVVGWYVVGWDGGGIFGPYHIGALAFSDNSMGVVGAMKVSRVYAGQAYTWQEPITYRAVGTDLTVGAEKVLVPTTDFYDASTWEMARVSDGTDDFLVVWADVTDVNVKVQRFTPAGVAVWAAPIDVAAQGAAITQTKVAGFRDGGFVVMWEALGADGSGKGIRGQLFDHTAAKVNAAFQVTAATAGDQQLGDLGTFSDGRFVVAYRDAATATPRYQARTFSVTPAGAVGDPAVIVNEVSAASASAPALKVLSNDDFVVAWTDATGVVWTRRYHEDSDPSPNAAEFRANDDITNIQETPSAAGTGSGNVMIAFSSKVNPAVAMGTEIVARVFDPDGLELRPDQILHAHVDGNQTTPVVGASSDAFVVAWTSDGEDGDGEGVFARRFDDTGAALAEPFAVNTTTAGLQHQPALAVAGDGTAVLAWTAQADAASEADVVVRIFSSAGAATSESVVHTTAAGSQDHPAVGVVPFATQAVVAWQSKDEDTSGYGIFLQKVGFDGVKLGTQVAANTTVTGDQRNPTITVAQNDSFAVCWESVGQGLGAKTAVVCRRFKTSTMAQQGAEYLPFAHSNDQATPVARFLSSGELAVAWAGLGLDAEGWGIQLARVNGIGDRVAPRVLANRFGLGDQIRPWLVPMEDRIFVGWQSNGQSGTPGQGDIYFRILPLLP